MADLNLMDSTSNIKFINAPSEKERIPTKFIYDNNIDIVIKKEREKKQLANVLICVCILIFITLSVNTIILLMSEKH